MPAPRIAELARSNLCSCVLYSTWRRTKCWIRAAISCSVNLGASHVCQNWASHRKSVRKEHVTTPSGAGHRIARVEAGRTG
eukprot:3941262-Rhodomonas_salina.6